jgi:hypothetical protein
LPVTTIPKLNKPKKKYHDSPLYHLKEWQDIMRLFNSHKMLTPSEAVRIELEPATIAELGLKDPVAAMAVTLRRYAKERGLPYDVEVIREPDERGKKQSVIYVSARTGSVT